MKPSPVNSIARFIEENRSELIERWLVKCRQILRSEKPLDDDELRDSLPLFIDEVIAGLQRGGQLSAAGGDIAQTHGAQRQVLSRDVADVTREYGLLFQTTVELAVEKKVPPFRPEEYAMLASCLSSGAAEAVREYSKLRDLDLRRQSWEHFAFLAHEVRNPLQTARLSVGLLRAGADERGFAALESSLSRLSEVLDRALVDARLRGIDAGAALHLEDAPLRKLLDDAADESRDDAEARDIRLVLEVEGATVRADVRVLRSAVTNLLRNAVKFTRTGGAVTVRGRTGSIEVEDECGGLQPGDEQKIFGIFRQAGTDRSGFGLGLAIAQQAIEAHRGELSVRNLPGKGCVFVVKLPS